MPKCLLNRQRDVEPGPIGVARGNTEIDSGGVDLFAGVHGLAVVQHLFQRLLKHAYHPLLHSSGDVHGFGFAHVCVLVKVDVVAAVRVAVSQPGLIFVQWQIQSFVGHRLEHAAVKVKSGHQRPWGHYAVCLAYAQEQARHVIEFQFHRQTFP